jgi:large subunit ribosomal protein L25
MAETIVLEATKRAVIGKQVKQLRAQGIIPGVLYGPAIDAVPLQIDWVTLRPTLREVGGSQIIELSIDGEPYNTLVRAVHRDPIRGDVLHIDFYRVRMDVAIRTEVPIVLVGDTEALEGKGGVLTHEMMSIEVECLPGDLPAEIEVDISVLTKIGDIILAENLPQLPGVIYHANPDDVVISTSYLERRVEAEKEEEEVLLHEDLEEPALIRRREEEGEEGETEV